MLQQQSQYNKDKEDVAHKPGQNHDRVPQDFCKPWQKYRMQKAMHFYNIKQDVTSVLCIYIRRYALVERWYLTMFLR